MIESAQLQRVDRKLKTKWEATLRAKKGKIGRIEQTGNQK